MSYSRHTGQHWQRNQAPKVPRIMTARKAGTCAQTGATISPGDQILWDPIAGQAYCHGSARYQEFAQQDRQPEGGRCIDAPCCGCCTI